MTTIRDVAKQAGVSVTTVSKALNGYSDINAETCRKIMEVASELNYRPNAVARSLVKKGSNTFGYIVSGLEKGSKHTIIQDCLCGIYDFARSIDYEILMFAVDSAKQQTKSYLQFAREHSLAGIIIQGIRTDDQYYREVLDSKIPCVLIDLPADHVRVGSISTDNFEAAGEVVRYLIGRGHRNIVYINGKDAASVSVVRYEGYVSMMRRFGLPVRAEYILNANFSEEEAYNAMLKFLPEHPEVTAVFCASDLMALGTMRAAQKLGIAIPAQLSVIGFDDILISSYFSPSLTTIRQNFCDMGFAAAKMLHDIITGKDVPHTAKIPFELIIRDSTG